MPLSNRAPINAAGQIMVTGTIPTAAWPVLGGMTYEPTTGELAVIDAVPAAGDPWVGGIRFTNLGSMYVTTVLPSPVFYVGGLPVSADGRLFMSSSAPVGSVGGWPVAGDGGVAGVGLSPVPIFFAPLTNSLIPTTAGNPTFTFSRATTAYVADNEGVLRQAVANEARFHGARRVRNTVTNSQNLTTWNTGSATIVFGVTGPTGLADANTITATGPGGTIYTLTSSVPGRNGRFSWWIRRRTGVGAVLLRCPDNNPGNEIDITAQLTGTWKRFASAVAVVAATPYMSLSLAVSGDAIDVTYAQAEDVSGASNQAPSEYVSVGVLAAPYHGVGNQIDGVKYFATTNGNSVTANVVTETAGVAIPAASLLGYVAENAATNLCIRSQEFDNASWVKTNITPPTPNTQTAPDGTLTAEALVATGVNGTCLQSVTVTATTWCFSVYLKRLVGTSQVAITTDGVTFVDITSLLSSSAWVRVDTNKALSAGAVTPGVRLAVSGDSVAIWGAQLE